MASSGPEYTIAWTSVLSAPYDDNAWAYVDRLQADDASEAYIVSSSYDANDYSELAVGTIWGFALPDDAVVNGITVEIEGRYAAGTASIAYVSLRKDGAIWGTAKTPNEALTSAAAIYTYGGATDTWGITGPTGANINETDFGVAFSVLATANDTDIHFDFCRVTVTYNSAAYLPGIMRHHIIGARGVTIHG